MRNSKGQFVKGLTPWNKGKNPEYMIGNKFCIGRTPYNKGKKCPEISITKIGKKRPDMVGNKFCLGKIPVNKGKKYSEEEKAKLNLSGLVKGRGWNKGLPATWVKGEKNHAWKGGVTSENRKARKSPEFKLWREGVFKRDNYTDQKYQIKNCELHPHHILNFSDFPDLRFDLNNGITLSKKAHEEFHKKYGKFNNTREQLEEFLKS